MVWILYFRFHHIFPSLFLFLCSCIIFFCFYYSFVENVNFLVWHEFFFGLLLEDF
eukprot:UN14579